MRAQADLGLRYCVTAASITLFFGAAFLNPKASRPFQATALDHSRDVTRATLDNGMKVVIVRNPLAPVVTVEQNYLVGGNETPEGFPGMAHAQEHMAFRGCSGLTANQISAIFAQLGGFGNADTQQNITQYFSTVPSADLDIVLRVDSECMMSIEDSQQEWSQEKGAIEQEVARDLSNPTYKFLTRLNQDITGDHGVLRDDHRSDAEAVLRQLVRTE